MDQDWKDAGSASNLNPHDPVLLDKPALRHIV